MKKVIFISLLFFSYSYAQEGDIRELIDKLEKRVNQLEKENKDMKGCAAEAIDAEERLNEVEKQAFKDKVALGIGFKNRRDTFTKSYADGKSYVDDDIMSTKAMINLKSIKNERFKFTGRLSMYKYWGDTSYYSYYDRSLYQGRVPTDSTLYVERAYMDWFINPESLLPITFSIGRMPTADGPSYQYMDDTAIKSNYPANILEASLDGMLLSFNLEKITNIPKSAVRFGYSKLETDFDSNDSKGDMDLFSGTGSLRGYDEPIGIGVFIEGSLPSLRESYFQYSYLNVQNSGSSRDLMQLSGLAQQLGEKVEPLGDMYMSSILLELPKLMNNALDIFIHYGMSEYRPSDFDKNVMTAYISATEGKQVTIKDTKGYSYWIGTRYTLPFEAKPKIGAEYNHASKDYIHGLVTPHDLSYKLATRGDAYELYYTHPIGDQSNIRLGGILMDYKYTDSCNRYAGKEISKLSDTQKTVVIDKITNTYLQLNVNF